MSKRAIVEIDNVIWADSYHGTLSRTDYILLVAG